MDDVETTIVTLTVGDDTNTTHVTTTSDHNDNTSVEANEVGDLASGEVNLHGVVDTDGGVGVADAVKSYCQHTNVHAQCDLTVSSRKGIPRPPPINQSLVQRLNDAELVESINSRSRIVRNQEWDPALAELNALDAAQLVLSLLSLDTVDGETALGVVDETEVLAGLLDGDDVHETGRVGRVSADLAVDLDETLHQDGGNLAAVKSVLQAIEEDILSVPRSLDRICCM